MAGRDDRVWVAVFWLALLYSLLARLWHWLTGLLASLWHWLTALPERLWHWLTG
jgi:hypothetical protein